MALGVFHCGAQNFDAIRGTADIDWPPAPIASEAYDPSRKRSVHRSSRDDVDLRGAWVGPVFEAAARPYQSTRLRR
jgi:hypothetical protein